MVKPVTITMDGDEPTLVFSRLEDLPSAIRISEDMGLPPHQPSDRRRRCRDQGSHQARHHQSDHQSSAHGVP